MQFVAGILARKFKGNYVVELLGKWKDAETAGYTDPIGGFIYYLRPPGSIWDAMKEPSHAAVYIFCVMISCGLFSKMWVEF